MARAIVIVSASTANALPLLLKGLAKGWLDLTGLLFDGYHPEKHYMRGPGPAWRKKHGQHG